MESRLAAAFAVALLLNGCATHAASVAPYLPLEAPPPPGVGVVALTAASFGVLVVDHGCVRVKNGRKLHTVIWMRNTRLGHDEAGYFLTRIGSDRRYRIGSYIEFGGGGLGSGSPDSADPDAVQRCGPPYAQGYLTD
ncbi:hypothetical protein [Lysobacter claricitrinus]|uniref:hypothetical protein n=1 Tax=Lysobacter claricitrinus TaxID=3367728 RepID=UPI0037DAB4BD